MTNRRILAIFAALAFAPFAAAQPKAPLDPEPNAPYRWQVGIRCSTHPVLSAKDEKAPLLSESDNDFVYQTK